MPNENKAKVINRLKNDKDFELVFGKGTVIISEDRKIKAKYLLSNETINGTIKFGITVTSKKGNSVWRNRIKRILREALIKEKETLLDIANQINKTLLIIFSPYSLDQNCSKKISLREIKPAVFDILNKLKLSVTQ